VSVAWIISSHEKHWGPAVCATETVKVPQGLGGTTKEGDALRQHKGRLIGSAWSFLAPKLAPDREGPSGTGWYDAVLWLPKSAEIRSGEDVAGRPDIPHRAFQDRCLKPLGHPSSLDYTV